MTVERATRNVGWVFGLYLVRRIIRLGYLASFARLLKEQGFGSYYFLLTVAGMLSVLSAIGMHTFMVRRLNRGQDEPRQLLGRCFALNLVTAMLFSLGLLLVAAFSDYGGELRLGMFIMGLAVVPLALIGLFQSTCVAYEKLWIFAVLDNAIPVIEAGLGLFLLLRGYGLVSLCTLHTVLAVVYAGVFYLMVRRHIEKFGLLFDWRAWLGYLREAWKIAASGAQTVLYRRFGVVILSLTSGNAKVGYFGAAMTLVEVLRAGADAFRAAVFPYMVRAYKRDPDELKGFQDSCTRLLVVLALPAGMIGMLLARPVLGLIFGARYEAGVPVLQVLVWMVFPLFMEHVLALVCFASGRLALPIVGQTVLFVARTVLSVLLILHFDDSPATGLAWAMLISSLIGLTAYTLLIRWRVYAYVPLAPLVRTAGATAGPVLIFFLFEAHVHRLVLVPVMVVVFAIGVFVFRVLTARELEIIGRALRSFRSRRPEERVANVEDEDSAAP